MKTYYDEDESIMETIRYYLLGFTPLWMTKIYWKIDDFKRDTKYRIQRFKRGYSNCDSWNYNTFFMEVTIPILKNMRKHGCGFPWESGFPGHGDVNTPEKWDIVLTKMIEGFELWVKAYNMTLEPLNNEKYRYTFTKEEEEKYNTAMELFVKYFNNLWD